MFKMMKNSLCIEYIERVNFAWKSKQIHNAIRFEMKLVL